MQQHRQVARRALSRGALSVLAGLGLLVPSVAWAQGSGRVEAEALFDSGLELMRAGEFTAACQKLEESQRVDPGVGTLLYLAECYELEGRTASAWATFREAAAIAGAEGHHEREAQGTERAQRLEPLLSRVTLEVAPESRRVEGLTIRRGDVVVSARTWDTPLPVDPGDYQVVVSAPGYRSRTLPLHVGPDADRVVLPIPPLEALPPEPQEVAPTPSPATRSTVSANRDARQDEGARRGGAHRGFAWVATGVGVAGLGVGSAFGLVAMARNEDALRYCTGSTCDDPRGEELTHDARTAATGSNIGFAVGAAGAVTAIALWLTVPPRQRTAAPHVAPWVHPEARAAGIGAGGHF